jgi:hypothetical protein
MIDIVVRCSQKEGISMRKVLVAVVCACLFALGLSTQAAHAQGTVTLCTSDTISPQCSSHATIQAAVNATKTMKDSTHFMIKLTNGIYTENVVIGEELAGNRYTMRGEDPQETIVQADTAPCVTAVPAKSDKRVLKIMGPAVRLENLTIQHGCLRDDSTSLAGAGVWSSGALSLWRVIVITNTVEYYGTDSVPAMGGGIYSSGALDIESSSFIKNQAITYGKRAYGGGVYSIGSARIVNSTFSENAAFSRDDDGWSVEGGAIYAERALDAMFNTIVNNEAGLLGGGLVGVGEPELGGNLFFGNNGPGASSGKDYICRPGPGLGKGPKCEVAFPNYVNLGPLRWDYVVPVYRPLADSLTIDAATCAADIRVDQLGEARGTGIGCDLGATESGKAFLAALVAQPQMPDLSIADIRINPQGELNSTNPVVIEVVIQNTGLAEARRNFWVDLYINPVSEPPNQAGTPWTDLCRSQGCANDLGISWKVTTNLLPGERLTLTSRRMEDPYIWLPQSNWNGKLNAGDVTMWAYVDSWNGRDKPWGWVGEITETNNRWGPLYRSVPQGKAQYPFSSAQFPGIVSDRPVDNE